MWERINKFVYSRVILSVFLLAVVFTLTVGLLGFNIITIPQNMELSLQLAIFTIGQLTLSGIAIWLMRKMEVFNINDFKFKNMGRGFLLAWVGFVYVIISSIISIVELPANSFITPNMFYILIVFVQLLFGTSILEEVFFRGLVLRLLLKKMGDSKRGIINACIISAVLFGAVHFGNILAIVDKSSIGSYLLIFSQVIGAASCGLFFAAIFLQTRKLWILILMHTLFNLPAYIIDAVTSPGDIHQITETLNAINIPRLIFIDTLLVSIPLIIAGLVLLRKVKPEEIKDWISESSR